MTVRYDMADENGETRRERNARFEEEAPEVDVPDEGMHVWAWFWSLSARRHSGPEPIAFCELSAWSRQMQVDVTPDEIEMLMAMDDAYLKAVHEEQEAARERKSQGN